MELNERDKNWQTDAPLLSAIGKASPFTTPFGYFEELSDKLKGRIFIESRHTENKGFKTPPNYFQELTSRIEAGVAVENIRKTVPSDGLTLPEGYFDGLAEKINLRLEQTAGENIPVRKLFSPRLNYAAAACITALITIGVYFTSVTTNFTKKLSEVPDQEIINYLQVHSTAGDTPFIIEHINPDALEHVTTDVSAEELELYIKNTTL